MLKTLQKNIDITKLSNFKTKAFSKYYFEIKVDKDLKKLSKIIKFANENNIKVLFIWWGTNLLFAFDIFDWIVIKNCLQWWTYDKENMILETYSWENISDIAKSLELDYWNNLWHRFIWLPWTVWWAIFGNAGCFWLETENNFLEAKVLNLSYYTTANLKKIEVNFSYRNSIFKKTWDFFIISAKFDLSKKIEKYSSDTDNIEFRETKQPKWNSCWSFFKNPSKELSAWFAIESVWLKGLNYNWVFFSPMHANFLINSKINWNWRDLIYIIELAQKKVKDKFWVELEPEVRIISQ